MSRKSNCPVQQFATSHNCLKQRGMSTWSLLLLFVIGGFVVTCVLKLGPVYYDNWNFRSILNDLETEFSGTGAIDKIAVRRRLQNRMNIDMIDWVDLKDVTITRDDDNYIVAGKYEARVELFGNVDVVLKFDDQAILSMVKK